MRLVLRAGLLKLGPVTARRDWLSTRTSLLARLKNHRDAAGWEEFCDAYGRVVHAVAAKSGVPAGDLDDIVQETMMRVARLIEGFDYDPRRGSFKSWVLTIARSRIVDCLRRRGRERRFDPAPPEGSETSFMDRLPDEQTPKLEELFDAEWQRAVFEAARERVRERISPRQFQIFDLHVRQEWPVDKVAATLGVNANQVYLAKHRVSEAIQEEVARLDAGHLPAADR